MIEPHIGRIPGVDKTARALLTAIEAGEKTFRQCFNRTSGLFVVCWAKSDKRTKKKLSPFGGQEAGRALYGVGKKKSDTATFEAVTAMVPGLGEVIDEYGSDSSDEKLEDPSEVPDSVKAAQYAKMAKHKAA